MANRYSRRTKAQVFQPGQIVTVKILKIDRSTATCSRRSHWSMQIHLLVYDDTIGTKYASTLPIHIIHVATFAVGRWVDAVCIFKNSSCSQYQPTQSIQAHAVNTSPHNSRCSQNEPMQSIPAYGVKTGPCIQNAILALWWWNAQISGPEADGRLLANSQIGGCACYGTNLKVLSKLLLNDLNVGIKRPEIKAFEGWRLSVGATKSPIELEVQNSSIVLIIPPGHLTVCYYALRKVSRFSDILESGKRLFCGSPRLLWEIQEKWWWMKHGSSVQSRKTWGILRLFNNKYVAGDLWNDVGKKGAAEVDNLRDWCLRLL